MCIVCWVPEATSTYSEYIIVIASSDNNGCTDAPECYDIGTVIGSSVSNPAHVDKISLFIFGLQIAVDTYKFSFQKLGVRS